MDGVKIESWLNIKSGREIRWENWAPPSSSPLFLGHPRANPPRLPLRGDSCICFGEMGRATAPIVARKPWLGGARPGLAKQPVEGSGVGACGMIVGEVGLLPVTHRSRCIEPGRRAGVRRHRPSSECPGARWVGDGLEIAAVKTDILVSAIPLNDRL